MSTYIISIFIACTAFLLALHNLNQHLNNYFDLVAFFMVFGGTIAIGTVLLPWKLRKDLKSSFIDLLKNKKITYHAVLNDCLNTLKSNVVSITPGSESALYIEVLRDGLELIQLGFNKEKISDILSERVIQYGLRKRKIANALKSLAKYPPAFGLVGTVLGLVNVMKGVSNGLGGKETALEMSVALVATMYGLIMANLIVNPSGELLSKKAAEEEIYGKIAIEAVLLMADHASLLECQETLNSYAPFEQRINLLANMNEDLAA